MTAAITWRPLVCDPLICRIGAMSNGPNALSRWPTPLSCIEVRQSPLKTRNQSHFRREGLVPFHLPCPLKRMRYHIAMDPVTRPVFAHRQNKEGTVDSICMKCFATVALSLREAEIEQREQGHRCDPEALERLNRAGTSPQERRLKTKRNKATS